MTIMMCIPSSEYNTCTEKMTSATVFSCGAAGMPKLNLFTSGGQIDGSSVFALFLNL